MTRYGAPKHQGGAILMVALMMLLIFVTIAAAIVSISGLEARMSAHDYSWQQAQQAADGGIEELQMTLLQGMVLGLSPPEILGEAYPGWHAGRPWVIELDENTSVELAWPDLTAYETRGSLSLKAVGMAGMARQDVTVDLNYNHTTGFVLCASRLKVSGHFIEQAAPGGSTVWIPEGEIVTGENRLAFQQDVTSPVSAAQLHDLPGFAGQAAPPPATARLEQFLHDPVRQNVFSLPRLSPSLAAQWLVAAEREPLQWQAWPAGDLAIHSFQRQFNYIKGSSGQVAELYIDSEDENWLNISPGSVVQPGDAWWRQGEGENNYPLLVIFSPYALHVTLTGNQFIDYPGYLLLVTPADIEIICQEGNGLQQLRLVAVAGQNLHLISKVSNLQITGSLNAQGEIHLEWGEWSGCDGSSRITLHHLPDVLRYFPYEWSLLGLGAITSYSCGN